MIAQNPAPALFNPEIVSHGWDVLFRSGETVELRFFPDSGANVGYFRDKARFLEWTEKANRTTSIYYVLNPVDSELYDIRPREHWAPSKATKDLDIPFRRHLLIDVDPIRPGSGRTKMCATDTEKTAAYERARQVVGYVVNTL